MFGGHAFSPGFMQISVNPDPNNSDFAGGISNDNRSGNDLARKAS